MPIKTVMAGGVSILGVMAMSSTAFANGCFAGQPVQNCNPGAVVVDPYTPQYDQVTIRNTEPLGHLRSVNFQRSPNVSITRVHGIGPNVALNDAPSSFTGGCHPSSTVYCRAGSGAAAPAPIVQQAPVFVAPAPAYQAPVYQAPVYQAPVQQPLRTWIGGGYDPSKFIPRQYGENTFTPGIAHIPTSIVDRDPVRADQVLNSGRAIPQPLAGNGGFAPRTATYHIAQNAGPNAQFVQGPLIAGPVLSGPVFGNGLPALPTANIAPAPVQYAQPSFARPSFAQPSFAQPVFNQPVYNQGYRPAGAPTRTQNGTYASTLGSDGTYWEKTSGLTTVGNSVATEVLCKRKLPTQVVNPVIGVPTPVCQTSGHGPHAAHGGFQGGFQNTGQFAPAQGNARYGAPTPSGAWTY